jgi:hypothetical protein
LLAAAASPEPGAALDERPARRVAAWTHRALLAERAGDVATAVDAHARAVAAVRTEQWEWVWSLRRLGALTGEGVR